MQPVLLSWLWKPHNAWRADVGYAPQHVIWFDRQLARANVGLRHVCVVEGEEWSEELNRAGIETYPLWPWPLGPTSLHGSDCYVRMGLFGAPGVALSEYLGASTVISSDIDVLLRPGAEQAWTAGEGECYWLPRTVEGLTTRQGAYGNARRLWHGFNGSTFRIQLGSRPDWWEAVHDRDWCLETQRAIVGSDQAALTRLWLESRGEAWESPNTRLFEAPHFNNRSIVAYGWPGKAPITYFPFDRADRKPWNMAEFQQRAGVRARVKRRGLRMIRL